MVGLGPGSRSRGSSSTCSSFGGSAFAGSLGLLGLAAALGFVGFDLGLDALLGLDVVELLLALASGLFDLFLASKFLLGLMGLLGGLLADSLDAIVSWCSFIGLTCRSYLVSLLFLLVLLGLASLLGL